MLFQCFKKVITAAPWRKKSEAQALRQCLG
jgi:hypothetical protein